MDQFKEQVSEFISRNPPEFPEFDCTNDEHKYRNIVYVCLKPECTLGNRLACPACLLQTHATHLNHLIEVKEIYLQTKGNVFTSNYPKDPVASEFRHYLKTQKE